MPTKTAVPAATAPVATSSDGKITARFVIVTPDMARQWLAGNTHNRHLRGRRIGPLVADMSTGNYVLNGETVKRAADGTLLDGQHRLAAIAESGIAQEMLVVEGLAGPAQETTDIGIKRNFSDVLALRGEKDAFTLAAVCRLVTIWEAGGRAYTGAGNITPTPAQMLATLHRYPGLRSVTRMAMNVSLHCDMPASHIGLGIWLFAGIDEEDADHFFARLADGQALVKGDPIYELRRALAEARNVKGRRSETYLVALMIKAWNAYRSGSKIAFLTFKPGGARPEAFPEPQ
jgi:hypothetical protein